MRICFLGDAESIHVQRCAKALYERGHNVILLTMQPFRLKHIKVYDVSYELKHSSIPSVTFAFSLIKRFDFEHRVRSLVKSISPDVIHAIYLTDYGILGARLNLRPYIIDLLGSDLLIDPKEFGNKHVLLMMKAFEKADKILIKSMHMKTELQKFKVDESKIEIIPYGVDCEVFSQRVDSGLLKQELDLRDSPVIISIRNFEPIYNLECLIRAIPLVLKTVPEAKFVLLGSGSLQTHLKNLSKNLGVSNSVNFIGSVTRKDVPQYLGLADVYVSTSLSDGLSMSTLEGAMSGLVPVLSDIPANRELMSEGLRALLFENTPKSLAAKLIDCLQNLNKLKVEALQTNASLVAEKYNLQKSIHGLESLYQSLIS